MFEPQTPPPAQAPAQAPDAPRANRHRVFDQNMNNAENNAENNAQGYAHVRRRLSFGDLNGNHNNNRG
jgi:hypothetical protein